MAAIKAEGEDEFLSFVLYCIWWMQHLLVDLSPAFNYSVVVLFMFLKLKHKISIIALYVS